MKNVEEQRLDQRRIRPHGIEVEDMHPLERERVFHVVEEVGVPAPLNPLLKPRHQSAWQQVREGEEPSLSPVEHVQILDGLIDFSILELAQAVPVFAFEQDADEAVEEVQVLRGRLQRERINADISLSQAQLHVAAVQERTELAISVTEIEHDRERVVLLGVGDHEIQEEALPASRSAEYQR